MKVCPNFCPLLSKACFALQCTYDDMCVRSNSKNVTSVSGTPHICVATPYVCPRTNAPPELQTCFVSSTCDGWGGCIEAYKPNNTVCYNITATDPCKPVLRCTGDNAVCPDLPRTNPIVTAGNSPRMVYNPVFRTYENVATAIPAQDGVWHNSTHLFINTGAWVVPCGTLTMTSGYYVVDDVTAPACEPSKAVWTTVLSGAWDVTGIGLTHPYYTVPDGSLIQYVLRGSSIDPGRETVVCGPTFLYVDASPPIAGRVIQLDPRRPLSSDRNPRYHNGATLAFYPEGFYDDQNTSAWGAGLKYEYMVAAYPLNASLASYWLGGNGPKWLGFALSSVTPLAADATRYTIFMRAVNRAGLRSIWAAAPDVIVDRTGPRYVRPIKDAGWVSDFNALLSLNWTGSFVDPESEIDYFQVGFGVAKLSDDLVPFQRVAANQTFLEVPFPGVWTRGIRYYATIRAWSQSGAMTEATSVGMVCVCVCSPLSWAQSDRGNIVWIFSTLGSTILMIPLCFCLAGCGSHPAHQPGHRTVALHPLRIHPTFVEISGTRDSIHECARGRRHSLWRLRPVQR